MRKIHRATGKDFHLEVRPSFWVPCDVSSDHTVACRVNIKGQRMPITLKFDYSDESQDNHFHPGNLKVYLSLTNPEPTYEHNDLMK